MIMTFGLLLFFRQLADFGLRSLFPQAAGTTSPFDFNILGVKLSGSMVLAGFSLGFDRASPWPSSSTAPGGAGAGGPSPSPGPGAKISGVDIGRESVDRLRPGLRPGRGGRGDGGPHLHPLPPRPGGPPLAKSYEVHGHRGAGLHRRFGLVAGIILGGGRDPGSLLYLLGLPGRHRLHVLMAIFLLFRPQGLFGQKV